MKHLIKPTKVVATKAILLGLSFAATSAHAVCTDFDTFVVGDEYYPGDTIAINGAMLQVHRLRNEANELMDPFFVRVNQSQIAGGNPSELYVRISNIRLVPNQLTSQVTMKIAHNKGFSEANEINNLAVNGEMVQLASGIETLKGLVLGNDTNGQVRIDTNMVHLDGGYWYSGEITFTALTGSIQGLTLGGVQLMVDDICVD